MADTRTRIWRRAWDWVGHLSTAQFLVGVGTGTFGGAVVRLVTDIGAGYCLVFALSIACVTVGGLRLWKPPVTRSAVAAASARDIGGATATVNPRSGPGLLQSGTLLHRNVRSPHEVFKQGGGRTSEALVHAWERDAEALLSDLPMLLARFRLDPPDEFWAGRVISYPDELLKRRLEYKMSVIEEALKADG